MAIVSNADKSSLPHNVDVAWKTTGRGYDGVAEHRINIELTMVGNNQTNIAAEIAKALDDVAEWICAKSGVDRPKPAGTAKTIIVETAPDGRQRLISLDALEQAAGETNAAADG